MPHNPDISYVRVEEWSPDGGAILVTAFRTDGSSQIGTLSVADGAYRALKTNEWRSVGMAAFSPGGRYVAYDLAGETDPGRDSFLLATDGSTEVPLVTGSEDDQLLGWLPNGRGILFHSRTSELGEIRALLVDGGEARGEPQLIRSDVWQIAPFGFTRNAFFYGILLEQPQIYVATIDLGAGRVLSDPVLLGDPAEGDSQLGVWSPEGQRIAYLERPDVLRGVYLVIRSVTGELQQRTSINFENALELRWAPDGSGLLLRGRGPERRSGVYRIDLRAGESELVLETEYAYTLSPDGRTLYHLEGAGTNAASRTRVIAHDMSTGENREIAEVDADPSAIYGLVPSPDGARLVLSAGFGDPRVLIISVPSGTVREIYRDEGGVGVDRTFTWTPDGAAVLWFRPEVGEAGGLWRLPVDGGTPRLLISAGQLETTVGLSAGQLHTVGQLAVSPDDRRILYTSGQIRGEYWMMTGFDEGSRE